MTKNGIKPMWLEYPREICFSFDPLPSGRGISNLLFLVLGIVNTGKIYD